MTARVVLAGARGYGQTHLAELARLGERVELVGVADPVVAAEGTTLRDGRFAPSSGTALRDAADGRSSGTALRDGRSAPSSGTTLRDGRFAPSSGTTLRDGRFAPSSGIPVYRTLGEALAAAGQVDLVVVATPIPTHFELAALALEHGADVLLEKPPAPSLEQFERLLELERSAGRAVQVGFQSLGSHAVPALRAGLPGVGAPSRAFAVGTWMRTAAYWARSSWAGRRAFPDGTPVCDGVVTNPLAHAVATALAVVGLHEASEVARVDVDLYRANPIEADDTSAVRVTGTNGAVVSAALTLCAPQQSLPTVTTVGDEGAAEFAYTVDEVRTLRQGSAQVLRQGSAQVQTTTAPETFGRTSLLENLLDHRETGAELLVPLTRTGAFMRVVEAIRTAPDPLPIPAEHLDWAGEGPDRHPVVREVEQWCRRAAEEGRTFAELRAPWARR